MTLAEPLSLPPLSSLLSAVRASSPSIPPQQHLNVANFPSLDFHAFTPEPLVHVPMPVSSFLGGPSSQQIPTFTPLICDPIVHKPVIDVCSSGYLVSAGPSISTTIPPLHPNVINPLLPQSETLLNGARETLCLLLASTQVKPQLMQQVLPATVLSRTEEQPGTHITGSHGLYTGTRDSDANANANANSIAAIPMVSFPCLASAAAAMEKKRGGANDDWEIQSGGMAFSSDHDK